MSEETPMMMTDLQRNFSLDQEMDPVPDIPIILYDLMGFWTATTGLLGFGANIIAVCLFLRTHKLQIPFNYVLMNLSVTELVITVTGNSVMTVNAYNRRWMLSETACKVNAFGMTYLGIQSITTLSILAMQRYMMVTRDRQFPLSTGLSTMLTVIFIWIYSFLVSSTPFFGWGRFGHNTLKISCGVVWKKDEDVDLGIYLSHIFYIYIFGFVLPLGIIVTSYLKIIRTIKMKGTLSQNVNRSQRQKAREVKNKKITYMVAVMILSFILIWTPYAAASILEITGYRHTSTLSYYILAIPTMLTKASVCADPIIYFGFNPQFRAAMLAWVSDNPLPISPRTSQAEERSRSQVSGMVSRGCVMEDYKEDTSKEMLELVTNKVGCFTLGDGNTDIKTVVETPGTSGRLGKHIEDVQL